MITVQPTCNPWTTTSAAECYVLVNHDPSSHVMVEPGPGDLAR